MRRHEAGFTALETILMAGIVTIMVGAATATVFGVVQNTQRTNDHLTAAYHAGNASYWISYDTRMADGVTVENLTSPEFLILTWTDWGYGEDSIYHVVTYSIEDVAGGTGKLRRTHEDSSGTSEHMLIAEHIYYDQADPDNITQISYQSPMLNLRVVVLLGEALEVREGKTYCRPNFR